MGGWVGGVVVDRPTVPLTVPLTVPFVWLLLGLLAVVVVVVIVVVFSSLQVWFAERIAEFIVRPTDACLPRLQGCGVL